MSNPLALPHWINPYTPGTTQHRLWQMWPAEQDVLGLFEDVDLGELERRLTKVRDTCDPQVFAKIIKAARVARGPAVGRTIGLYGWLGHGGLLPSWSPEEAAEFLRKGVSPVVALVFTSWTFALDKPIPLHLAVDLIAQGIPRSLVVQGLALEDRQAMTFLLRMGAEQTRNEPTDPQPTLDGEA